MACLTWRRRGWHVQFILSCKVSMTRLTAANIVHSIKQLPKNTRFNYLAKATKTQIEVVDVVDPEGPITINRYTRPKSGSKSPTVKKQTISAAMVRRVANAMSVGVPRNLDRVLGGSYNTRSALESLLAHTPEFQYGYPGRIENFETSSVIKKGHKHLMWLPDRLSRERCYEAKGNGWDGGFRSPIYRHRVRRTRT